MNEKRERNTFRKHVKLMGDIISSVMNISEGIKLHHRIIYTSCIFMGVVLVWYGLWDIVSAIPFINKPVIALITGVCLLVFTGSFFKELS